MIHIKHYGSCQETSKIFKCTGIVPVHSLVKLDSINHWTRVHIVTKCNPFSQMNFYLHIMMGLQISVLNRHKAN